jgi:hypothetical protein
MFCEKCGAELEEGARFCGMCGSQVELNVTHKMSDKEDEKKPATIPQSAEDVVITNLFGTVTDKAVHFNVKRGLFAGSSQEILPIRHVTSVRLETSRHWIWGILLVLVGLPLIQIGVGVVLLALGILLIWGSPKVVVNTSGGDLRPSVSWPWTRTEATEFTNTLRNELLKRG